MTVINQITAEDIQYFTGHLSEYQQIATKSALYPGQGTPLGLAYVALKMNGEAGEFAEHVGKAMRDDNLLDAGLYAPGERHLELTANPLTPERKALLIKEIGDVLWYLSAACNELGINLEDAALVNLHKLQSRTERNALRGSGDER
jgi:NTP pyrophosphatase (non-canonical NTP hydrolase)